MTRYKLIAVLFILKNKPLNICKYILLFMITLNNGLKKVKLINKYKFSIIEPNQDNVCTNSIFILKRLYFMNLEKKNVKIKK